MRTRIRTIRRMVPILIICSFVRHRVADTGIHTPGRTRNATRSPKAVCDRATISVAPGAVCALAHTSRMRVPGYSANPIDTIASTADVSVERRVFGRTFVPRIGRMRRFRADARASRGRGIRAWSGDARHGRHPHKKSVDQTGVRTQRRLGGRRLSATPRHFILHRYRGGMFPGHVGLSVRKYRDPRVADGMVSKHAKICPTG
jgi:hypothetical protein